MEDNKRKKPCEKIIKSYYSKYFIAYHNILKYDVVKRRDNLNQPFLYIEFEKQVNKWKYDDDDFRVKGVRL